MNVIYQDGAYDKRKAYQLAVGIMVTEGRVSTSFIQRRLSIGYNKAAALVERACASPRSRALIEHPKKDAL